MKRPIPILALFVLLAACGRYTAPDIRVRRTVAVDEIIGTWVLRGDSLSLAKRDPFHPYHEEPGRVHEIQIRADGTCHFRSITQMPTAYVDCEGTWRLGHSSKDKNVPQLDLILKKDYDYMFSLVRQLSRFS